jgi:4a-hydroxytetrahydrobiopterin dehydratase
MEHNINNWEKTDKLTRKYKFKNFVEVIEKVNLIKDVAEKLNHHPNLFIKNYNELEIEIYTHESNDITEKDYKLAEEIDSLF